MKAVDQMLVSVGHTDAGRGVLTGRVHDEFAQDEGRAVTIRREGMTVRRISQTPREFRASMRGAARRE